MPQSLRLRTLLTSLAIALGVIGASVTVFSGGFNAQSTQPAQTAELIEPHFDSSVGIPPSASPAINSQAAQADLPPSLNTKVVDTDLAIQLGEIHDAQRLALISEYVVDGAEVYDFFVNKAQMDQLQVGDSATIPISMGASVEILIGHTEETAQGRLIQGHLEGEDVGFSANIMYSEKMAYGVVFLPDKIIKIITPAKSDAFLVVVRPEDIKPNDPPI